MDTITINEGFKAQGCEAWSLCLRWVIIALLSWGRFPRILVSLGVAMDEQDISLVGGGQGIGFSLL